MPPRLLDSSALAARFVEVAAQANRHSGQYDIQPVNASERSGNELRPQTLDQMVGQEKLKPLLRRIIDASRKSERPMDHMLLVGQSGTGKTTIANIVANELGQLCYQIDAPVSHDLLVELAEKMNDGDILFIDEIHRQVAGDRRGVTAAVQPEIFYHVLEDRRLATPRGVIPFPEVTVVGATTDAGLLPEPFLARFPLQPRLDRYTDMEMSTLAERNAASLGLTITDEGAIMLGRASRSNPRQVNTYVRNARTLAADHITADVAREIIVDLNDCTLDGLTLDMQQTLLFLLKSKRTVGGETRYQASINNIATYIGKSRDTKAVQLYVEPELIRRGLVQVAHGGRLLTDAGIQRAKEL